MSSSVLFNDKSNFKSKRAIDRLKKDIKANIEGNNLNKIDSSKYVKEGFNFTLFHDKQNKNINVTVITNTEYFKLEQKRQLKEKLQSARYRRSGQPKQKLNSVKRTVPEKIFKAYTDIIKKYSFDIPSPDTVINNLDKHKLQVSMLMNTSHKISNDKNADNKVKKYFKLLGEFLGLEPIDLQTQPQSNNLNTIQENDQNTDTEDEPELVEINN